MRRRTAVIRIGAGAGFASDRFLEARDLIEFGNVDYLVLECLGERTVATAQRRKRSGRPGYGVYFEERIEMFLEPATRHGTTIITNDGAADPKKAGERVAEMAAEQDLRVDVTVVTGDDCEDCIRPYVVESHIDPDSVLSANAYLGCEPLIEALSLQTDGDAHFVVTGRVADPSLYVAPMVHEFGWALDDWDRLGQGTVVGHLLECAGQVTGGFFMDPIRKPVADPHLLGKPFVDIKSSGEGIIGKVDRSGGRIDTQTCLEQLFYEVHDPARYLTPDVTADFTGVELKEVGKDKVRVTGGCGTERPESLKVSVGVPGGFKTQCYRAYGAPNAKERARLAGEIVRKRVEEVHGIDARMRIDILGVDALFGEKDVNPEEVLLRVAASSQREDDVRTIYREVSAIAVNGPAAASTYYPESRAAAIQETIGVESAYLPRSEVNTECQQIL